MMSNDLFGTYNYRIKLTIDHTKINSNLTWFPVTVFLTSSQGEEVFNEFDNNEDFDRIAFTSSDGVTQLYADCELFDISNSKAIYHVSKTGWTVSSSTDTVIYLYYDNDAGHNTDYISKSGDTAGRSVWDSNFKAVYHMHDKTTSTIADSTSNINNGNKKAANQPIEIAGKVGKGQDFDGTDDYIDIGDIFYSDKLTIECIASLDVVANKQKMLVFKRNAPGTVTATSTEWQLSVNNGILNFLIWDSSDTAYFSFSTEAIDISTYYYLVGVAEGVNNNVRTYINGVADGTTAQGGAIRDTTTSIQIGARSNNDDTRYLDGIADEVRISNTNRSADWIAATYASLFDTLLTYGSQEQKTNVLFMFENF